MRRTKASRLTSVRWQSWDRTGLEHLALQENARGIAADSVLIGTAEGKAFALSYQIVCDRSWRVREVELSLVGGPTVALRSDGDGNWSDYRGKALPKLRGAIDVDISATPFTNTLPIRRLDLGNGESQEIIAAYFHIPTLEIIADRQRYTRLDATHYRYDSVDSDFTRKVEVDGNGLVVTYPGLFRRLS